MATTGRVSLSEVITAATALRPDRPHTTGIAVDAVTGGSTLLARSGRTRSVELRYAPLPYIGLIAWHYWFVVSDGTGRHRWEVWQTKNAGGFCIGHVAPEAVDPSSRRLYAYTVGAVSAADARACAFRPPTKW